MFTPDEYYIIVEFTGAGTRRDEVVEEIQQQQQQQVRLFRIRYGLDYRYRVCDYNNN